MIRKKEKTTGCLLLVPLPGRQEPFASQAKNLPPGKGVALTCLVCPGQSVPKNLPPVRGNRLRSSCTPVSRCREKENTRGIKNASGVTFLSVTRDWMIPFLYVSFQKQV